MKWDGFRLVYRAMSPIHIGWHTLGYIKLTRRYITGKNMWGAMTANLTRIYGTKEVSEYAKFGELLKSKVLAGYFYPAVCKEIPLVPCFKGDGLFYGKYPSADFERLFIHSYGQTAILPHSNTAEDETLHESEFIVPIIKNKGKEWPVYFIGYIFINKSAETKDGKTVGWDNKDINLKEAMAELFVGGDRKYGWGRLTLEECYPLSEKDTFFGHTLALATDFPQITPQPGSPIPAHLPVNNGLNLKGNIEPFVGREWAAGPGQKRGPGQKTRGAEYCWVPGSVIGEGGQTPEKEKFIGEFGLLS